MSLMHPVSTPFARRRWSWPVIAGVVLVATLGFTLSAAAQQDDPEPRQEAEAGSGQEDANESSADIERVVVIAPNYVSTGSRSATKSDAPLVETPQAVTVISRDQIDLLHWTSLQETVRYTAGAVGGVFGPDTRYDWLLVRGFAPVQYIDGLQAPVGSVSNVGTDLYGYQAVDILKGPSSVLYGQTPPGGIVNMTSRRPQRNFGGEVGIQAGNFERQQVHGDVTGALGERAAGRLTFLYRDRETQVDFTQSERVYVAPAVTFYPGDRTELTLLGYYQDDAIDNHSTGFLPAQGTMLDNPHGEVPIGRNIGEPGLNFYNREQYGVGYDLRHEFSNGFELQQNVKLFNSEIRSREVYGTGLLDADGDGEPDDFRTVTRSDFPFNEDIRSFNVDTRGYMSFETGALSHRLMMGLDYRDYENTSEFGFAAAPPIDLFDPQYGVQIEDPALFPFTDQTQEQTGVYLQDQINIDRWYITLSGRHDWLDTDNAGTETEDREFTYRAGVNYVFDSGLAPYAQVARSFQPVPGSDFDGRAFEPSTGEQVEVGLKYASDRRGNDWNILATAAAYQLVQENVLTPDPDNLFFSVQAGEVEVSGLEFEAVARYQERLSFNASYTYIDTEITESNGPDLGQRIPMVPEHKASLLVDYSFTGGALSGLGLNAGVRYRSSTFGDPANQFRNDAVTLLDATVRYDLDLWRFAINASNLTDKHYVERCDGPTNCFFGTRRTVIASATRRF